MIIDSERRQILMEARDINYILPAYIRSYQFHSKNELPLRIIQPMFPSVKAANGVDIPIEYVQPLDKIATDIAKDGNNVAEVTPEQEAVLDEKDRKIEDLKKQVDSLTQTGRGGEERGGTEKREPEPTSEQLEDEAVDKKLEEDTDGKSEEYIAEHGDTPRRPEGSVSPAKSAFSIDPDPTHQPKPDRKPKQPPGGDIGAGQSLSNMQPRGSGDQRRTARDLLEEPEIEGTPEKEFGKEIKRDKKGKPIVEDKPNASGGQ